MNAVRTSILIILIVCASSQALSASASPTSVYLALYEDAGDMNWTITIGQTNIGNPIPLTDIYVMMKKNNSMIGLMPTAVSDLPSNSSLNGVSYHDISDPAHLNEWDYFILNKTTYGIGSSITLTTPDRTITYATATIGNGHPAPPRPSTIFLPIIALVLAATVSGTAVVLYFHRKRKAGDK